MLLNLLALLVILALPAAGVAMIIRALLEPMPGTAPTCAACGRDAAELTDFTCPGCGRDVRIWGLVAAPLDSAVARFWRAAAVTTVFLFAFMLGGQILWSMMPYRGTYRETARLQPGFPTSMEQLEVTYRGTVPARASRPNEGLLIADLTLTDGRMTTLEVEVPARRGRVTDEHGNVTRFPGFDEPTFRKWFESSGIDTSGEQVNRALADLFARLDRMARPGDVPERNELSGVAQFSTSSGRSTGAVPPTWFGPTWAVACAAAWLPALRRSLRRRVGPRPVTRLAAPEAVAA